MKLTESWFELAVAFASGTGIKLVIDFFTSKRKQKLDDFERIIKTWETDNERLRLKEAESLHKIEQAYERIQELETLIHKLQQKMQRIEKASQDIPIPMWLKDTNGVMLALNTAYEEVFLIPRGFTMEDYLGKNDLEMWDKEIAERYIKNDQWVLKHKKTFIGEEEVEVSPGIYEKWTVIKYPRLDKISNQVLGVAGICIKKVTNE